MNKFVFSFIAASTLALSLSKSARAVDMLKVNERLENGTYISSPNGKYSLIMQTDGSLVIYRYDGSIRYSMAKRGTFAVMQGDGNFVEYAGTQALWSTGTYNCCNKPGWPEPYLRITDDGNLRVESLGPAPVWQIGTDPSPPLVGITPPITTVYPPGTPPSSVPVLPSIPAVDNTAGMPLYKSRY